MYEAILWSINEDIIRLLFNVKTQTPMERKQVAKPVSTSGGSDNSSSASKTVVRNSPKVGRNDPCPCGSGLKYKKCCGK